MQGDKERSTGEQRGLTASQETATVNRREYLKLSGIVAASVTGMSVQSDIARAATTGYGDGGYGEGSYGDETGVSVLSEPETNIETDSATLNGSLEGLGGAKSASCYFKWRETGADNWTTTTQQTRSSTGSYSASISGLTDGMEYEYYAVAEASDGDTDTGSTITFTTIDDPPVIVTDSPSNVTDSSVTLNGSLDDLANAASADCYLLWRETGASSWNATATQTLSSTGQFSADLSGLSSSTEYEYMTVTEASDGDTNTGRVTYFTTKSASDIPVIDSYSAVEAGSPNPHFEVTADWNVSDPNGNLDVVKVEVLDSSDSAVGASISRVGGSSASGTDQIKVKSVNNQTFDVRITVIDTRNNSTSQTKTLTE